MTIKMYKLRHIPTGLFFKPYRHSYRGKCKNLTKDGKVYTKKPSLSYLGNGVRDAEGNFIEIVETDWEIVNLTAEIEVK